MRILHFTHVPVTIDQIQTGGIAINTGCGWLSTLFNKLYTHNNITFSCAAFSQNNQKAHPPSRNGKDCYLMMSPQYTVFNKTKKQLEQCNTLINKLKPDLIHIHGTEEMFGLLTARNITQVPTVISLQGLLTPYSQWYNYFGTHSLLDVIKMHRWLEIPAIRGQLIAFWKFKQKACREREIIQGNRFFIGRTYWDRAQVEALNPKAHYFYGGELLREPFSNICWDIDSIKRHRVIFSNAVHSRKGTEILLDAIELLIKQFPDIELQIAGSISSRSGYGRYLRKRILKLQTHAIELGKLNANEMAHALQASHIFVSPSYIDNSPNAVCEAQLIGMPVISTYTGGIPSLISDGETGLFVPTGDAPALAARIKELFSNDALASHLGKQARNIATKRHDASTIVTDLLSTYNKILELSNDTNETTPKPIINLNTRTSSYNSTFTVRKSNHV